MWFWQTYHRLLWSTKAYVWNPLYTNVGRFADWFFNQADWQVRRFFIRNRKPHA